MDTVVWQDATRHLVIPHAVRAWLLDNTSLTQRLRKHCAGLLRVHVVTQCWQRPLVTEAQWLHLPLRQYVRVRQVYLYCQQSAWVFARTIMPRTTLEGPYQRLTRLGSFPLGNVLFANATLTRQHLQVAQLSPQHTLYRLATAHLPKQPEVLWARRSIFYLADKPLIVSEVFLPALNDKL